MVHILFYCVILLTHPSDIYIVSSNNVNAHAGFSASSHLHPLLLKRASTKKFLTIYFTSYSLCSTLLLQTMVHQRGRLVYNSNDINRKFRMEANKVMLILFQLSGLFRTFPVYGRFHFSNRITAVQRNNSCRIWQNGRFFFLYCLYF
jgi:hypothetical protein